MVNRQFNDAVDQVCIMQRQLSHLSSAMVEGFEARSRDGDLQTLNYFL